MSDEKRKDIQHVAVLDWTKVQSAEDISGVESIQHVGVVLIAEHLAGALGRIHMQHVGSIVPVPAGAEVKIFAGQARISGDALASSPDSIWIVAGQMFITSPVREANCKEIRVSGQLFAPRGSEAALSAKITRMEGQTIYYPEGARFFMGREDITAEFLELLPAPVPFMILGEAIFADDVTFDLLRNKVLEIGLAGKIIAPKELVPLLQVLTVDKMGEIRAKE
jgi:hypothetical protein